jgi:hypothetical protein
MSCKQIVQQTEVIFMHLNLRDMPIISFMLNLHHADYMFYAMKKQKMLLKCHAHHAYKYTMINGLNSKKTISIER